jgi:hypothetical protein
MGTCGYEVFGVSECYFDFCWLLLRDIIPRNAYLTDAFDLPRSNDLRMSCLSIRLSVATGSVTILVMSLPVHVDAHSGFKADERPREFVLDEEIYEIAVVLDHVI